MFQFFQNVNITACVQACEGFGSRFENQLCVIGCEPHETNWVTLGISLGVLSLGFISLIYCCVKGVAPQREEPGSVAIERENSQDQAYQTLPQP